MKIKNWKKFQHFKDRRPPWIKVHRELLDDRRVMELSNEAFGFLTKLWLLASEHKDNEGQIPDVDDIAFRLRMDKRKVIKLLQEIDIMLISDDIKVFQDGPPETETERETERETYSLSGVPPDITHNVSEIKNPNSLTQQAKEILEFLNEKANKNFQPVEANLDLIKSRLKESSARDCRQIIAKKVRDWKDDEVMSKFLRPATLFNKTKFAQYQGELLKLEEDTDESCKAVS